jgi:hypothetical protein
LTRESYESRWKVSLWIVCGCVSLRVLEVDLSLLEAEEEEEEEEEEEGKVAMVTRQLYDGMTK